MIPIGHDQGELRRWPVLTFTIIVLCFVVYWLRSELSPAEQHQINAQLRQSIQYYLDNPDLKPPPSLKRIVDGIPVYKGKRDAVSTLQRVDLLNDYASTRPERQAELDRLCEPWIEALHSRQTWRWGYIPGRSSPGRLFTYMFIHSGFLHVFFNMLFLYLAGPMIEDRWGRPLFAGLYLITGVLSAAFFALHFQGEPAPLVGASGAVAGVMGAFLVRYPFARIRFMHFFFLAPATFSAPAWLMLPLWFFMQLTSARESTADPAAMSGGVAYWAHVWGFAFGAAMGGVIRWYRVEERFVNEAVETKIAGIQDPALHAASKALAADRREDAYRLLGAELTRNPGNGDAADLFLQLGKELECLERAVPTMSRALRAQLRRNDLARARSFWEEIHALDAAALPEPAPAVKLARHLAAENRHDDALTLIAGAARTAGSTAPASLLADIAHTACALDSPIASEAVSQALAHPAVDGNTRRSLQNALAAVQQLASHALDAEATAEADIPLSLRLTDD